MGNFSRDPDREIVHARERGYTGLRIEQGVPVLDRDLNLLADLVSATVRSILARHLGDGIAERGDTFAVEAVAAPNDFRILAAPGGGTCLVGGVEARISRSITYGEQPVPPPLTTPQAGDRDDVVYLDVWVDEVDAQGDADLSNAEDVGAQTSVRLRPEWRVRVAEGTRSLPAAAPGHAHHALAILERRQGDDAIRERMIIDLRQTGLHLGDLARRVQRIEDILLSRSLAIGPAPGATLDSAARVAPAGGGEGGSDGRITPQRELATTARGQTT